MDNSRLSNLCGPLDQHLRQLEEYIGVTINNRGGDFYVSGAPDSISHAKQVLKKLYAATEAGPLSAKTVHLLLQSTETENKVKETTIKSKNGLIRAHSANQHTYLTNIETHDINFGIGPAGTGKTYLAVACAANRINRDLVKRLILVRPAVEAGEKLGFLPGDLVQKVDPYLRPLYDALYEIMGMERVNKLIENQVIEVAPLAFMRGRSLNESFIILDEAQNTTIEQMKMFMTRIGFNSTMVITGDITQIDLPEGKKSGLTHGIDVLADQQGISFTFFGADDVVRHPLVARIVTAYEEYEKKTAKE